MKVLIVKACAKSPFKEYKKYMGSPPQSIFSLAACTPDGVEVGMVDETIDMKVDFRSNADIVAIFFSTPDAYRGYEIADRFRKQGKTVVLGGLHVKFNQAEASAHADSLLIGECEDIWGQLLMDWCDDTMQPTYERETETDLNTVRYYPKDVIGLSQYDYMWSVLVSRGCINKCHYCLVNRFFKTMRFRPIREIVDEIKWSGAAIVELHSDNLTADREYAKALFEALIPLGICWMGETTADFADDHELLELAGKSGLSYLLLGLETPSVKDLAALGKAFLQVERVKEQIKKLHNCKVLVDSAMMFGLEGHTHDIFEQTLQFVRDIDLDVPHAVVPIPFPGSRFYQKLDEEGKLLTKDWSKYDGRHLVFKHDHLTPEDVEQGIRHFEKYAYTMKGSYRYNKFVSRMYRKF